MIYIENMTPPVESLMKNVGSDEFISRALLELSMFDINQI